MRMGIAACCPSSSTCRQVYPRPTHIPLCHVYTPCRLHPVHTQQNTLELTVGALLLLRRRDRPKVPFRHRRSLWLTRETSCATLRTEDSARRKRPVAATGQRWRAQTWGGGKAVGARRTLQAGRKTEDKHVGSGHESGGTTRAEGLASLLIKL